MPRTASAVQELAGEERDVPQSEVRFQVLHQLLHFSRPARVAVVRLALVEKDSVDGRAGLLRHFGAVDDPAVLRSAALHEGLDLLAADGAGDELDAVGRGIGADHGFREPVAGPDGALRAFVQGRTGRVPLVRMASRRGAFVVPKHANPAVFNLIRGLRFRIPGHIGLAEQQEGMNMSRSAA